MAASTSKVDFLLSKCKPALSNEVSAAKPGINALDAFKLAVAQQISNTLSVPIEQAFDSVEIGKRGADLNVPVPKFRIKGDPKALAKQIANKFEANDYLSEATSNAINVQYTVRADTLASLTLNQINELTHLQPEPMFGCNDSGKGKKAVIEYSSPNIAKEFHAGHLRSTIIGEFLCNLYKASGWEVIKMNYLGDWGKQFGILTVGYNKYGSEEALKADPILHLHDVYVKINADARAEDAAFIAKNRAERRAAGEKDVPADGEKPTRAEEEAANVASSVHDSARKIFERMENDDQEALKVWQQFRDISIAKYKETYSRLNVSFDVYSGESQVSREAQNEALTRLQQSNIVKEDKGALVVDLEKYKMGKTIVRKRDGTTTYISRDIGGAIERYEKYKFDKMVYVVASQQDLHLAQFFRILQLLEYPWADKLEHINYGMVLGMSTRKGTAVSLEQILNEAKSIMHEQMQKSEEKYSLIEDPEFTADTLGMSAVKIQDMAAKRVGGYKFDWSRMTSYLGDTGPYLQYAHVRLSSIIRKAGPDIVLPPQDEIMDVVKTELLTEPKAREVLLLLASYPEAVKAAFKGSEPTSIVGWCWKLTHAVSSAYEVLLVRGQEKDVALARLFLYTSAKDVLGSAMRLLTLTPLERM